MVSLYEFFTERYLRTDFNGKHLLKTIIQNSCDIDWIAYKGYSFTQCKSQDDID